MHTFTAQPIDHPACLPDDALLAQCDMSRNRTRGPGGQHRNKVESAVHLVHQSTGVEAQASERRSAVDNQRVALKRLRFALAVEVRRPVPPGEIGSALWRARRTAPPRPKTEEIAPGLRVRVPVSATGGGRIACNPDHQDMPALIAEALDVIADAGWDARTAAIRLQVSATQLVRLLKDHPPALERLNRERTARGEHPLK